MKVVLEVVGALVLAMALIGASGVMDFRLCFKAVGQCELKGTK